MGANLLGNHVIMNHTTKVATVRNSTDTADLYTITWTNPTADTEDRGAPVEL